MKALTFDELWTGITDEDFGGLSGPVDQFEKLFNLIRQGTLLEEEAIRIPDEKDWPQDAKYISVVFMDGNDVYSGKVCEDIPRPQPVGTPRREDLVFVLLNGYRCVGSVHAVHDQGINVQVGKEIRDYPFHLVKPFSPEKVTSDWEGI